MKVTKKERQSLIQEIVQTGKIRTQQDLLDELTKREYRFTQATISRDMRELGIIKKINAEGCWVYHLPPKKPDAGKIRLVHLLNQCFRSYRRQKEMVVIYTLPGSSPALGNLILEVYQEELFTVMTNDDHLLIIAKDEEKAIYIIEELISFQEKREEGDYYVAGIKHS